MNSKIEFEIFLKKDGSYAYATPKTTNTISSTQLAEKVVAYLGLNMSPDLVETILRAGFECGATEVIEGNRVYYSAKAGKKSMAFYPIFDKATLRLGDKDSEGNVIPVTAENLAARAAQFEVRLGCQVSTNFGDLTKRAHVSWNGKVTEVENESGSQNQGGNGGSNGGGNNPDENVLG